MDDLIRNLSEWCPSDGHDAWPIMRQAAAEIRSLRAQVAQERADTFRQAAILEGMEIMREAAAKWAEDDAKLCDCSAHSESECACGAWCEWKTVPMRNVVQALRNLDPVAILAAHTRAKETTDVHTSMADPGDRRPVALQRDGLAVKPIGDSDGDDGA